MRKTVSKQKRDTARSNAFRERQGERFMRLVEMKRDLDFAFVKYSETATADEIASLHEKHCAGGNIYSAFSAAMQNEDFGKVYSTNLNSESETTDADDNTSEEIDLCFDFNRVVYPYDDHFYEPSPEDDVLEELIYKFSVTLPNCAENSDDTDSTPSIDKIERSSPSNCEFEVNMSPGNSKMETGPSIGSNEHRNNIAEQVKLKEHNTNNNLLNNNNNEDVSRKPALEDMMIVGNRANNSRQGLLIIAPSFKRRIFFCAKNESNKDWFSTFDHYSYLFPNYPYDPRMILIIDKLDCWTKLKFFDAYPQAILQYQRVFGRFSCLEHKDPAYRRCRTWCALNILEERRLLTIGNYLRRISLKYRKWRPAPPLKWSLEHGLF